jgi:integrase
VTGPKQTVKQYLEHWLEDSRRLKIELSTLMQYRSVLRARLIPAFGHVQLDKLSKEHVQQFYAEMYDDGFAPRSIQFTHRVLSSALRDAVSDHLLLQNVCENVTVPRVKKSKKRVLNKEQCKRLVAEAKGRRLWFFILLALTTGARRGELLGLRWEDIDVNNLQVHIHRSVGRVSGVGFVEKEPKTESGLRNIRLAQVVIDSLPEHQIYVDEMRRRAGTRWQERGLVFPNRNGNYIYGETALCQFRAILAKAGLPKDMRIHDLRHSMATLLFAAGVNAKVIQEALGHSSITITLGIYGDVMPDMQQGAADVMDGIFE